LKYVLRLTGRWFFYKNIIFILEAGFDFIEHTPQIFQRVVTPQVFILRKNRAQYLLQFRQLHSKLNMSFKAGF
jgi:hypothetical protein